MVMADAEELFGRLGAPDLVFEAITNAMADVGEMALHTLDVRVGNEADGFTRHLIIEFGDIFQQRAVSGHLRRLAFERGGELGKNPRVADRTTANHQTGGLRPAQIGEAGGGIHHIAVGDHRKRQRLHGLAHTFCADRRLIEILHAAGVDGEPVDAVSTENFEQPRELVAAGIADAGLHGESAGDGLAQSSEQTVDFLRLAQQSPAGILAADDGCRAAEIQIDAGHLKGRELFRGAHQARQITADHLCEKRPASAVLGDRPQDVRTWH